MLRGVMSLPYQDLYKRNILNHIMTMGRFPGHIQLSVRIGGSFKNIHFPARMFVQPKFALPPSNLSLD